MRRALIYGLAGALLGTAPAVAQDAGCTLDAVIGHYRDAVAAAEAGRARDARKVLEPLAEAGFGPAQRRLAEAYASGAGVRKSAADAAFWSGLAARAADGGARQVFARVREGMPSGAVEELSAAFDDWKAANLSCPPGAVEVERDGEGKLRLTVDFHKKVGPADKQAAMPALRGVLKTAAALEPGAKLYLSLIDAIELYPVKDNRYHRYVGFKRNIDKAVIRMPVSNFGDDKPDFTAKSLLLAVKRRVYDRLGERMEDRLRRRYGGVEVIGSVYPDVRNRTFFDMMRQSFEMVGRLPPEVRKYVEIIDEIYYNPSSQHMKQEGTLDATAAYYNRAVSTDGYRVIFVRRDVLYASPLFMVRLLVHEGTHAVQDAKAWQHYVQAQRDQAALNRLKRDGKGESEEAKRLAAAIEEGLKYPKRWYEGVETATGRVQDIAFECEALMHEIDTVRHLGGGPDLLQDSGYLKLCPDAQKEIVTWKDQRLKERRDKAAGR